VFVVDGREEVDRLWALGVVATCPPASREVTWAWTGLHSKALAGRRVAVVDRVVDPKAGGPAAPVPSIPSWSPQSHRGV
jgi:hypothetical protein